MSVNKAILLGNVCQDPEVKVLESGRKVATFNLATNERGYTLANGTQVPEKVEYHSLVLWAGLAEVAEKYVRKGSQLYVEGKITTRSWEKDGIRHYKTEIMVSDMQMLGAKKSEPQPQEQPAQSFPAPVSVPMPEPGQGDDENGGLPF
jgi:single-strand DNA-binding protein